MTLLFRLFFRPGKKLIKEANQKDIEIRNFTKGNIVEMIGFYIESMIFKVVQGKIVHFCAYNIKGILVNIS